MLGHTHTHAGYVRNSLTNKGTDFVQGSQVFTIQNWTYHSTSSIYKSTPLRDSSSPPLPTWAREYGMQFANEIALSVNDNIKYSNSPRTKQYQQQTHEGIFKKYHENSECKIWWLMIIFTQIRSKTTT